MKPKAQPCPRQDSQQTKDVQADRSPKGDMADSVSPHDNFTGLRADAGKVTTQRQGENTPAAACGLVLEAWRGSSISSAGQVCR